MAQKPVGYGTGCGIWFALVCLLFWIGVIEDGKSTKDGLAVLGTGILSFWFIYYVRKKYFENINKD